MLTSGGALIGLDQLAARYESSIHKADLFGDQAQAQAVPVSRPKPLPRTLTGPLTVLLAGIDPRHSDPYWVPRADTVLVAHIPAGLDRAFIFSLPRDLLVAIPPFPRAGYPGTAGDKLAHAMFFGSQVPGDRRPNIAQGFELLAATVSAYTGIPRFDAGAIIDFSGFRKVIDALGGIDMKVDQPVSSIHLGPDGKRRQGRRGPQMTYLPGRHHFAGWQALDYARQRYIIGGDYARQRHQQELVQAIAAKALSSDTAFDPLKLDKVLRAAGQSLTFSGRGYSVLDWAFSLRDIRPDDITLVELSGGGVSLKKKYLGEALDIPSREFLLSVVDGSVDGYLFQHPEMVHTSH